MTQAELLRCFAAILAGAILFGAPACAANRILVSAKAGVDAGGCGTQNAPCRTFQFAHDAIAAGGEIHIVDPGDYGRVNITKSLSIINEGVGTAGALEVPAGINAIEFNGAATDRLYLRGITVDAPAGGLNGVLVNSAGKAILSQINARRFVYGVNICPRYGPVDFILSNSRVSENKVGVAIMAEEPPGSVVGVIENVVSANNRNFGARIDGENGAAPMRLTINNSVFSNNGTGGVYAFSSTTPTSVSLRDVIASDNLNAGAGYGFGASGTQTVMRISHSVATGNDVGVKFQSGAIVESYGDNDLRGNSVADIAGGGLVPVANQ